MSPITIEEKVGYKPRVLAIAEKVGYKPRTLNIVEKSWSSFCWDFFSDNNGFTNGVHNAGAGVNWDTGYLTAPGAAAVITKTLPRPITSGIFRVDFWFLANDAETAANNTKNFNIYLLPASGSAASANSIATVFIVRDTTPNGGLSADATYTGLDIKSGATNPRQILARRYTWWKVGIVANFTTHKYDFYLNDVLWLSGADWPNASAADFSRIIINSNAAAPDTYFDAFKLTYNWALPSESALILDDFTTRPGDISGFAPAVDARNLNPQTWLIASDQTTFGTFTRGANGLTPTNAKQVAAFARCGPEGIFTTTWKASAAGVIYMGLMARVWAGLDNDSYLLFRYNSADSAGNKLTLFQGNTVLAHADPTGVTISASGTYTLKMVCRGRYIWCYVNDVLQLSGPFVVDSLAHGGRGLLCEEHAGPYITTVIGAADNYCTAFSYTGLLPARTVLSTGNLTIESEIGSVKELYHSLSGQPASNLFWSRGMQFGHRSSNDMGEDYSGWLNNIFVQTNVKTIHQRGILMSEIERTGVADIYLTITRRGIWILDQTTAWTVTQNVTPDNDFRGPLLANGYLVIGPSGSSTALNNAPYVDWRTDLTGALPLGMQIVTAFGTGNQIRLSTIVLNVQNWARNDYQVTHKWLGNCDPISIPTGNLIAANVVDGTVYMLARAYLIECGALTASNTVLAGWRDDLATPMSLTFVTGTVKTDAAGDTNKDGFNECYGWYEVNAAGGALDCTLVVAGITRYQPQIRINGTVGSTVIIDGTLASPGTDYVLDNLGYGTSLLQILSNRAANTHIQIT